MKGEKGQQDENRISDVFRSNNLHRKFMNPIHMMSEHRGTLHAHAPRPAAQPAKRAARKSERSLAQVLGENLRCPDGLPGFITSQFFHPFPNPRFLQFGKIPATRSFHRAIELISAVASRCSFGTAQGTCLTARRTPFGCSGTGYFRPAPCADRGANDNCLRESCPLVISCAPVKCLPAFPARKRESSR